MSDLVVSPFGILTTLPSDADPLLLSLPFQAPRPHRTHHLYHRRPQDHHRLNEDGVNKTSSLVNVWHGPGGETDGVAWKAMGKSGLLTPFRRSPKTDHVPRAISSSNLTFSLSDGWAFVETEDWRKDLTGDWSGCGADGGRRASFCVW